VEQRFSFKNIIGRSTAMTRLFEMARVASQGDQTVLITGESGCGKELLARAIHYNSPRRAKPLVVVDCSALAEQLLESELFGHVRGAFTGAAFDKIGAFEEANGGTVFLDEISDASKPLQQKLRRVLQEGEIRPVGSSAQRTVDVRVLVATNKDLRNEVDENRFLRDLYFRINRFPIHVPPLRERAEDVPLLALHFLKNARQHRTPPVSAIHPDAMSHLVAERWEENNVRELRNTIELACDLAPESLIDVATLRRVRRLQGNAAAAAPLRDDLVILNQDAFQSLLAAEGETKPFKVVELQFLGKVIIATLKTCGWKLRPAAKRLGLSPGKFRENLRDYLSCAREQTPELGALAAELDIPEAVLEKKLSDFGLG
jgi:transcriptional regulator with GAF, ATPase, and Fis domain